MKQKTFSASTIVELDNLVNSFFGRQAVDGRTTLREVLFKDFVVDAGSFYASFIYKETTLSNN